jgi:ParB-like chromosome segregation protein Spo0J
MAKAKNVAKNNGNAAVADKPAPAPRKNLAAETIPTVATVMVSPAKLKRTEKFRGRQKPVGPDETANLADMIRKEGQLQPIRGRQIPGTDEYEVIFGNTRAAAGELILNGYDGTDGKSIQPAPDFKMRVEVIECTDEEAFRAVVTENSARFKTSPIDDAYNQKRLREELGMSDVAIATYYGQSHSGMVNRLKKLIDPEKGLSEDLQNKVSEGTLGIYAALDILDATATKDGPSDKEAQTKIWLKAVDICGKDEAGVNRSDVANAIKAWRKETKEAAGTTATPAVDPATGQPVPVPTDANGQPVTQPDDSPRDANNNPGASESTPRSKQLTVKQFKEGIEEIAKQPKCPANVAVVVNAMLGFIEGKVTDLSQLAKTLASVVLPDSGDPSQDTLGDYTQPDNVQVGEGNTDPTA